MSIADARFMLRQISCLALVACGKPSFQDRIDELDALVEVRCGTIREAHDLPPKPADSVRCLTDAFATEQVGKLTSEYDDFSWDYYGIDRYYTIDGGITMLSMYLPPWDDPPEYSEWRCTGIRTFENGQRITGVDCVLQDYWPADTDPTSPHVQLAPP